MATDYEIVAVEVKTDESFFSSLSQAAGYSVFANRCYLAEVERGKGRFTREQIEMALHLGVGLLKIRSMSTEGIEPMLDAPAKRPPRRFALQVLEAHGLSECVVCKGVFYGTWKNGVKRSDRKDVRLMLRRWK